ncbi:hypothetical protein ACSBR1_008470 [Camellia fascicularis]
MQDNDEVARAKLLRNKREVVMKQMRHDIVVLLRSGQDATSRIWGWNQALSIIKNGDSHWALYEINP